MIRVKNLVRVAARRARSEHGNETGAVLILALIFMVVTALIVTGLAAFSGNDIKNIGNFKTGRSALYAADGAVQTASWNIRYAYPPGVTGGQSTTAWTGFCPSFTSGSSTSPMSLDNWSIDVTCSVTTTEGSIISRTATISAYPSSLCNAGTQTCKGHSFVTAVVQYNDFSSLFENTCTQGNTASWTYLPMTSCGSGETIISWVVQPGLT